MCVDRKYQSTDSQTLLQGIKQDYSGTAASTWTAAPVSDTLSTTVRSMETTRVEGSTVKGMSTSSNSAATAGSDQPGTSKQGRGGLSTSDMIAIAIGVLVGVATILGSFFSWKIYVKSSAGRREKPYNDKVQYR